MVFAMRCTLSHIAKCIQTVVIIRPDRIIQCFSLDCPIESGNDRIKDTAADIEGSLRYLIVFSIILLALVGCATSDSGTLREENRGFATGPVWPPAPQPTRIQFIRSISGASDIGMKNSWFKKTLDAVFGKAEAEVAFLRPYGVFADSERLYVTDPGIRMLHVFDLKEKKSFTIQKAGNDEFLSPIGVAVDTNGDIYLSDSLLKRVFVFDRNGKYQRDVGSPELFARPAGMTIDRQRLFVVDTYGHKISVFSKDDASFLFSFGRNGNGAGEFHYPTNIFIDHEGLLYVTDSMNFRVQIFDRQGNFITTFGKHGNGSGDFTKPKGIAVDSERNIYVADALFDTVQLFDKDGRLLLAFGKTGRGNGQMVLPAGLFVDEQDRIYVADSYNKRVQIFQYVRSQDSSGPGAKDSSGGKSR